MDVTEFPNAAVVSARWVDWRRATDIAAYDARFERLAAAGNDVHGEADFVSAMDPGVVLDAGCGTGRVANELARRGIDVMGVDLDADMVSAALAKAPDQRWSVDDLARMQLPRRFDTIALAGNVMLFCEPADRRLIVHNLTQHLLPGGRLVAGFSLERNGYALGEWDDQCSASGLELIERFADWTRSPYAPGVGYHVSVHRRIDRFTVHDLLAEARAGLTRMTVDALGATAPSNAGAGRGIVVVDTRPVSDRLATGWIPGSVCPCRAPSTSGDSMHSAGTPGQS